MLRTTFKREAELNGNSSPRMRLERKIHKQNVYSISCKYTIDSLLREFSLLLFQSYLLVDVKDILKCLLALHVENQWISVIKAKLL